MRFYNIFLQPEGVLDDWRSKTSGFRKVKYSLCNPEDYQIVDVNMNSKGTFPRDEAQSLLEAGKQVRNEGRNEEACALFRRSLETARSKCDKRAEGYALVEWGFHLSDFLPPDVADLFDYRKKLSDEACRLFREINDEAGLATVLRLQASDASLDEGKKLVEQNLAISRRINDSQGIISATLHLGMILCASGEREEGTALMGEALNRARAFNDPSLTAKVLYILGIYSSGEWSENQKLFEEAIKIYRDLGWKNDVAQCLNLCASLAGDHLDIEQRERYYQESLRICQETGNDTLAATCYLGLAGIEQQRKNEEKAKYYKDLSEKLFPFPILPSAPKNATPTHEELQIIMRSMLHSNKSILLAKSC
jgi:tetratricopeptide (TPR) repeat protein